MDPLNVEERSGGIGVRATCCDKDLTGHLALKMEEGASSQGMEVPLEAGNGKKVDSPRKPPLEPYWHLDFSLVRPI